ncbi:MAG: GGDEF domain-containing protein, partial [Rhodospirillales bacterium]|nr:GGDEF domain-containing protein [Rhodospirillales bacterium]
IDLDNFKLVNDTFGHHLGDEAIIKVRDILLKHTRPSDAVVRQGGDEFAIWFNQVDEKVAEMRARELIEASKELDQFSGNIDRPLGFSIGIAMYDPALTESLDDLMLRADAAMYQVKKSGKGGYAFARPAATGETEKGE